MSGSLPRLRGTNTCLQFCLKTYVSRERSGGEDEEGDDEQPQTVSFRRLHVAEPAVRAHEERGRRAEPRRPRAQSRRRRRVQRDA